MAPRVNRKVKCTLKGLKLVDSVKNVVGSWKSLYGGSTHAHTNSIITNKFKPWQPTLKSLPAIKIWRVF